MNRVEHPKVSVIIPWRERPEIVRTLHENCPLIDRAEGEIILVNCGGNQNRLQNLLKEAGVTGVRAATLPVPGFNKSLALNLGLELSRAAYFFSLDSDVILKGDVLEKAIAAIAGKPAFATVTWMHESGPEMDTNRFRKAMARFQNDYLHSMVNTINTQVMFSDGTGVTLTVQREDVFTGSRPGNGLLLVRKADLLQIEGYNSELELWGWEDLDILLRLKKCLRLEHIDTGEVLHLSHGDELRALNGQTKWDTNLENLAKSFSRYGTGDFLGTFSADRAKWQNTVYEWVV